MIPPLNPTMAGRGKAQEQWADPIGEHPLFNLIPRWQQLYQARKCKSV